MRVRWAAGLLGSTISSFLCSPIDLVKVRLQVSVKIILLYSMKKVSRLTMALGMLLGLYLKKKALEDFSKGRELRL